jgi:hypothetical protein
MFVTFSIYFLKGVFHCVEIIYEFLPNLYIEYALYRIFFANYFILISPCPFNFECSVLLVIFVLIFSTIPFSGGETHAAQVPVFQFCDRCL